MKKRPLKFTVRDSNPLKICKEVPLKQFLQKSWLSLKCYMYSKKKRGGAKTDWSASFPLRSLAIEIIYTYHYVFYNTTTTHGSPYPPPPPNMDWDFTLLLIFFLQCNGNGDALL